MKPIIKIDIISTDGTREQKEYDSAYEYKQAVKALEQLEALNLIDSFYNVYH